MMKFTYILNILISLTLLLPPGLLPAGIGASAAQATEWDSGPVSVSYPAQVEGETISDPVSVSFPAQVPGDSISKPVSVSYASAVENGTYMSRPASASIQPASTGDPDLVGLWHLDGDWTDSSGNNNDLTPLSGVNFSIDAKVGITSAAFNGSNSYLRSPSGNNLPLGSSPRTFMAWIKPFSYPDATYNGIVAYGQLSCTGNGSLLSIKNDGRLSMAFWCNDAYQTVGPPASLNDWNHVAFTYDGGTTVKFYMNGQFVEESPLNAGVPATTQDGPIRIGSTDDPGRVFNGLIDEVAIYKRALTDEEIAIRHASGRVDPAAPQPPVLDAPQTPVGSNTVTFSGTKPADTAIWVNNKKIVVADSSTAWQGEYVGLVPGANILHITAVDADYRMSDPVKATVFYDDQPPVIVSSDPANNSDTARAVSSVSITLSDEHADIDLTASIAGATVVNSSVQAVAGTWNTSGSSTIIFTPSTPPFAADTYTVTVNPTDSVGNAVTAQIVFKTFDSTPPVTEAGLDGTDGNDGWFYSPVVVTLTAGDGILGSGVANTEYSFDGTTWQEYSTPFAINQDGVNTLYYRSTDVAGNVEAPANITEIKINTTRLVGLWHMENDAQDSSIVGNHGAGYGNATFISTNAKIGSYSASFDGIGDYISIPDSPTLRMRKGLTIAGWFYVNAFDETWQALYWKGNSPDCTTNCENREYALWLHSDGHLHFTSTPQDKVGIGQMTANTPAGTIQTGKWYYFATVIDGDRSAMKIYVGEDGGAAANELGNAPYSPEGIRDTLGALHIGSRVDGENACNGLVDEVAVYKRALMATEIQELFRDYAVPTPAVDVVTTPTNTAAITLSGTKTTEIATAVTVNGVEVYPSDNLGTWTGAYTLEPGMNTLYVTAVDIDGFHSRPQIVTVALDVTPPTVGDTVPADNSVHNVPINSITMNLTDAFSALDLAATVSGATVKKGTVPVTGTWNTSGTGTSGSVTFTSSAPMAEGVYTALIQPTDSFGNSTTASITFTVDATAPNAPTIDQYESPTRNSSIIISGNKTADTALVVIGGTGISAGSVTYPTTTTWSAVIYGLVQGTNTVFASAVDAAGNTSAYMSVTIIVDTTPPPAPTVNATVSPTRDEFVTLSGAKTGSTYLYVNSQKTPADYAALTWNYSVALTAVENTFTVYTRDEAGNNSSMSAPVTIIRDTAPPVLGSAVPAAGSIVNAVNTITVTLSDAHAGVDLATSLTGAEVRNISGTVVNGTWAVSGADLVFTPAAALVQDVYTVTLIAADSLGNTGTISFTFTLDTAAPELQSFTMNPPGPHKAETVTFTVTFTEPMLGAAQPVVMINGAVSDQVTGTWVNATTWQGTYTFTGATGDGSYTVSVSAAQDSARNAMAEAPAGSFELDTVAPGTPTINPVTELTKDSWQSLAGTRESNTAIIINGIQRVSPDASTAWQYTYTLKEGGNTLTIAARDAAGNESGAITPAPVITLDTTPPAFTVDSYQHPSPTATQTVSGAKEPGCTVTLNGAEIIGSGDTSATWSHEVTLTPGITNHLAFTAADALNNTVTRSIDILYDISAPPVLGAGVLTADGNGRGTDVTLQWDLYDESTDNVGYYRVYSSTANFTAITGMTSVGTVNAGARTFTITGLTEGQTYYFAVVPVDTSGNFEDGTNVSAPLNTASAIPTDALPPEDVTIEAVTAGYNATDGNTITVTWQPSANSAGDLADQVLYFDSGTGYDAGTSLGAAATSHTKTGLADASVYKFRITTKDTSGHESAGVTAEGVTRLSNPAGLAAKEGNGKVTLTWDAVNSPYVGQYNIYRATGATQQTDVSTMQLVKAVPTGTTSYLDTGLTNGATYQYAVTALNASGVQRTDVASIGATPRADDTGPTINSFDLTAGQIITAPITISASASDAESVMGRVELLVDGTVVKTQGGAVISYYWNVVESTDGSHTVTVAAYDALGNKTEESRQVTVSLAPPSPSPSITSHTAAVNTADISGTAPLHTNVVLKVNGVVAAETPATATGAFALAGVSLIEGDNLLAVKAAHRGGDSPYSADYTITLDTGAPPAPKNLAAAALPDGAVRFTWENGAGEVPSGFNLYMNTTAFTAATDAGVTRVNTAAIAYFFYDYTPADDTVRYYAVTGVDSSGNESNLSNVVSRSSDGTAPTVAVSYQYTDASNVVTKNASAAGFGTIEAAITVSEPLGEQPFFSLEPTSGSPIVVSLQKVDDTHYQGSFIVDATSPHGPTTYKFSGKDLVGNRGTAQGAGITLDVQGPAASIQAPLATLQITTTPVQIDVVFDEPSLTVPVLGLKASDNVTYDVTGLATSDSGLHWTGSLDASTLAEGRAEFVLSGATDQFGNVSTVVAAGKTILVYGSTIPAPDAPLNAAATPGKNGLVTFTWDPVAYTGLDAESASVTTYKVFRRAEGEATPAELPLSGITGPPVQDTPGSDGTYYYSVRALVTIGAVTNESVLSAEATVVSDRTGPGAPSGLALSLSGNGVEAVWIAPTGDAPASYRLYRSSADILSSSGLTPVAGSATLGAVDTAPVTADRYYAVSALDSLGNEGPVSTTAIIDFPVSPVRDLVVQRIEQAAPQITWAAPAAGSISGYFIYRNGSRVNGYPMTDTTYADAYYAGGRVTYGISAVDNLGHESPVREVTFPGMTIGIAAETVLRRGLLETVPVIITNSAPTDVTIDSVRLMVGDAAPSTLAGLFIVPANGQLQLEKVVATAADALSTVAVGCEAVWSPSPGATVRVYMTSTADVVSSGSALEIFSDPLIRGTNAAVRLKVSNLGTARMEFLTSENSGVTHRVRVQLKDQDGNLLSTGYLDQRTGPVVNTGSYAVARLTPGETITTDPIILPVPASAPYAVVLEAVVEKTYYHYNTPEQVTAPGMTQSLAATISETAYRAAAQPELAFYPKAMPVVITGQALSNSTNTAMAYVPVKIGVSVRGFDRFYTVTTDSQGNFSYTFTPSSNEAGTYSVWAVHPDVNTRPVQSTFTIAGLAVSPQIANWKMLRGATVDIPVNLKNTGDAELSDLSFAVETSQGITAEVVNPGDTVLTAKETQRVNLRVTAAVTAPDNGYATMSVSAVNPQLANPYAQPVTGRMDANLTLVQAIPIIAASPSYIDTGMVRGSQKVAAFTLRNRGEAPLVNARIEGLSTSWMSLTVNNQLGDIKPGESRSVGIILRPPETLAQGVYDDRIVIYADNHIPYTYHIQVTVTSDAVGNVAFDALNELYEDVGNATITVQHQQLTELIYSLKTGADGTVMLYDVPEGRYVFTISASGHKPFSGSFSVTAGLTTTVPIALEVNLVNVEWSVTPVIIEDVYEITVSQTFETNVPTPVLVTEPPQITVPELQPGEVFNGEFNITNYGLIGVDNVNIQFPASFGEYDVELLSTIPGSIGAMQRITVPYRITRRQLTAASSQYSVGSENIYACTSALRTPHSQLFAEVQGYGGACYNSFTITVSGTSVICKGALNEMTVTKTTSYTVTTPVPGSSCGGPSTGTTVGGTQPIPTYGGPGGGGGGQSSGGIAGPGVPGPIQTIATIHCIYPRTPDKKCSLKCDTCIPVGSSLDIGNGTYTFTETDLTVPARAIPVAMSRTYRSNQIMKSKNDEWVFAAPMGGPLGYGWFSPWFERAGDGSYLDGEGNYYVFERDANGNFLPHAEAGLILTKTSLGYEVTKQGGNTRVFNTAGKLAATKDQRGNAVTLNYDPEGRLETVADATGRTALTFAYAAGNSHVESVTDIAGRTVTYTYDTLGNLNKAVLTEPGELPITLNTYIFDLTEYPEPPTGCFYGTFEVVDCKGGVCSTVVVTGYICLPPPPHESELNNYHNMIKRTNAAGESWEITYNEDWRSKGIAGRIKDPSGRTLNNTYDFGNGVFLTTEYNGRKYKRIVNDDGKLVQLTEVFADREQLIKRVEYLPGRIEKTEDALKNVTTVYRDEWDNVVRRIDARGNEWAYTYDAQSRLLSETDPLGTVNRYEYDEYGNKTKEILAQGSTDESITTYTYNEYNELTSITRGAAVASYGYDAGGNLNKITDPKGNITTMLYDDAGHLQTRTRPLVGDTTYADYHYKGKPETITDPNGNVINYTYDAGGRVKTVTNQADGSLTRYFYVPNAPCGTGTCSASSGAGKIDYIILPEGNKIDYEYDVNGNLVKVLDNAGNYIQYGYDSHGNRTSEQIKDNLDVLQKSLTYTYDLLDRQKTIVNPDDSFTEYGYDAVGNRISIRTPNSELTIYEYDVVNRLKKTIQPGTIETVYSYDRRNNLTSVTDDNNNSTTYEYDSHNRVIKTVSPDTGTTAYTYDLNGNLKTRTDAKDVTITYSYDALNRVTKIDFPLDVDTLYEYDTCVNGKGRLCKMTDASGITTYTYTLKGEVATETRTIDGVTYTTGYTYDKNGNMKTMTYPSGRVITYNYTDNRVIEVLDGLAKLASDIAYKPFGGMSAITYGNDATGTISYDTQYRLREINIRHLASGIMHLSYDLYDYNGNIKSIKNLLDATKNKSYTYDDLNRLETAAGPWGSLGWLYDGVGNRQTQTEEASSSTYAYETGTNKLTGLTTGGTTYPFTYDTNGNTDSELRTVNSELRSFVYNQNQRLIQVVDGGITKGDYVYNGNGQRVKKTVNGVTTIFHYSLSGQLITESDAGGTVTAEYVYLNGNPLAKIEGSNVYYYHNDHLNTPQKLTDGTGAVVWSAVYKPFGEATVTISTTTNNLRFPGQYYDAETGLNYNYFRDYNPIIGRYIEADPLQEKLIIGGEQNTKNILDYLYQYTFVSVSATISDLSANLRKGREYRMPLGRVKGKRCASTQSMNRQHIFRTTSALNLYSYVNDNPARFIDPLGLMSCSDTCTLACGIGWTTTCGFTCVIVAGTTFGTGTLICAAICGAAAHFHCKHVCNELCCR